MTDTDHDRIEAGRLLFARPFAFVKGCVRIADLPPAEGVEIAFVGRSNVGKSSLINAVTGRTNLARTSNTPGRTQELNIFVSENAPLTIRVCRSPKAQGHGLDAADPRLSDRATQSQARLPAGRRTARAQGQ